MHQIPNLNTNDLQKLDEKILSSGPLTNANSIQGGTQTSNNKSTKIDKNKKDLFKKITSHLIGRNVLAQLFRNPVPTISDLQPINNNKQQKSVSLLDCRTNTAETGLQMQQLFQEVPR
jgi:exportin-5